MRKYNFATSLKIKHALNATHAVIMSLIVSNIHNTIIIVYAVVIGIRSNYTIGVGEGGLNCSLLILINSIITIII